MPYLLIHSSSLIFIFILPFLFSFSFLIPNLPIYSSSIFFLFILDPISSYSFFIHYPPNHFLFFHYPAIFFLFIPPVLKILSISPVLLLNFQMTIPYLLIHLPKLDPTLLNKIFLSYP